MWELRPREGRDTHRQCTRPLDFNISTCQLHFFKTAACLGIMSSLILRLHLEKTKGFSAPHPTRKEQKAFYLKEHSKGMASVTNTTAQSRRNPLNTQPLPLSWDFPSTITTPSIGDTTLTHTPVALQCTLTAAGAAQYCLSTCQQNRQT